MYPANGDIINSRNHLKIKLKNKIIPGPYHFPTPFDMGDVIGISVWFLVRFSLPRYCPTTQLLLGPCTSPHQLQFLTPFSGTTWGLTRFYKDKSVIGCPSRLRWLAYSASRYSKLSLLATLSESGQDLDNSVVSTWRKVSVSFSSINH